MVLLLLLLQIMLLMFLIYVPLNASNPNRAHITLFLIFLPINSLTQLRKLHDLEFLVLVNGSPSISYTIFNDPTAYNTVPISPYPAPHHITDNTAPNVLNPASNHYSNSSGYCTI